MCAIRQPQRDQPLRGAAYWAQVLGQARTNTRVKKLLVASRVDVGGLPAGAERIDAFVRDNGFDRFIRTSAYTGEGCEELMQAIHENIVWDELPKITTTRTLAALRDYLTRLKAEHDGQADCPRPAH